MLRCKAAADLATSAFGFSALIAAMLVCQCGGIFQPRFSLGHMLSFPVSSQQRECHYPAGFCTRSSSRDHLVTKSFACNLFWCLHNVKLRFTFPHPLVLNFAEQADLHRSNIRFRLDQAYVFLSNVCKFKTVKSVSVLDIFSPCLQLLSRRNPWLAQSTSFYLLLLSALCFTGSVGEGKKQRLFFHRNSCQRKCVFALIIVPSRVAVSLFRH